MLTVIVATQPWVMEVRFEARELILELFLISTVLF